VARWPAEVPEVGPAHRRNRERDEDARRTESRQAWNSLPLPRKLFGLIDPDMFDAEVWKPIAQKAGMPGTRFHDLRHFFASQLIANGETAAYVRDQMGHSSIKVTFDTYGHLFPGRGKEASDRYEKAMRDAREKSKADVRKMFAIEGEEKGGNDATN